MKLNSKTLPLLALALFIGIAASCDKKEDLDGNTSLTVEVMNSTDTLDFVAYKLDSTSQFSPFDTIVVYKGSPAIRFDIDRQALIRVMHPEFAAMMAVVAPGEKAMINVNWTDKKQIPAIQNSPNTKFYYEVVETRSDFQEYIGASLNPAYVKAAQAKDEEAMAALQVTYLQKEDSVNELIASRLKDHKGALVKGIIISEMSIDNYFSLYEEVAAELETELPDHLLTVELNKQVTSIRPLMPGNPAPEISLPTPDGEMKNLSDLKGQYVMIDFWAAWCGPCRQENPNVVRMYERFHSQGFEIFGVSLDRDRAAWVKAIDDDKLPWVQVSDLKYFQSVAAETYAVGAIPMTFLLDKEGNIIARNLRGKNLELKLEEIFN